MPIKATIITKGVLTDREAEILRQICEGQPDKLIARSLAISLKTVATHTEHIYEKLQIRSASINKRCAALGEAITQGLIRLSTGLLCIWLIVSMAMPHDQTLRGPHMRLHTRITRIREAEPTC